jgi:hypothetical protein
MLDPRIVASSVNRLTDAGERRLEAVREVEWLIGGHIGGCWSSSRVQLAGIVRTILLLDGARLLSTARYPRTMKGDRVEIVVAADDGSRTYEIVATRAGRRVEITTGRGIVEVAEVTRNGEPVRKARFMATRVLALVEHPASELRGERAPPDSAT